MKKLLYILILLLSLTTAFADVIVTYNVFDEQNNPVNDITSVAFVCGDTNCNSLTPHPNLAERQSIGNQVTYSFPTFLQSPFGYGIFYFNDDYIHFERKANWFGNGVTTGLPAVMTKIEECRAPIQELSVVNEAEPFQPLQIEATINTSSRVFSAFRQSGPIHGFPDGYRDFLKAFTEVTFTAVNEEHGTIESEQMQNLDIFAGESEKVAFTFIPQTEGNYTFTVQTTVPDEQCVTGIPTTVQAETKVTEADPTFLCHSNLRNVNISNPTPVPGEDIIIYGEKLSSFTDSNGNLFPKETELMLTITGPSGVVEEQIFILDANEFPTTFESFEIPFSVPNEEGLFSVELRAIANECESTENIEFISRLEFVSELPEFTVDFIVTSAGFSVEDAEVNIDSQTKFTDSNGETSFIIEGIDDYTYVVSKPGFKTVTKIQFIDTDLQIPVELVPETTPNSPPILELDALNPIILTEGDSFEFDLRDYTIDENVNTVTYEVSFNFIDVAIDGSIATVDSKEFIGETTVTFRAVDEEGLFDIETINVIVQEEENEAPVINGMAVDNIDQQTTEFVTDSFDAFEFDLLELTADAVDTDGTVVSYLWDFDFTGVFSEDASGISTQIIYNDVGTRTIRLMVEDNDGAQAVRDFIVAINEVPNNPPVLELDPIDPIVITEGEVFEFNLRPFTTDENLDTVRYEALPNFVAITIDGSIATIDSGTFVGETNAIFRAIDEEGLVGLDTITIIINELPNEKPILELDPIDPVVLTQGDSFQFDLRDFTTDENVNTVTYKVFGDIFLDVTLIGSDVTIDTIPDFSGPMSLTFEATDEKGLIGSDNLVVIINERPNENPVANANGPYSGEENEAIQFSSAGSFDSDGVITDFIWDFGDGSTSTQANPTHVYTQAGTYTVTLTVTDDDDATDSDVTTAVIEVEPEEFFDPTADPNGPYTGTTGVPIVFDGSASTDNDENGSAIVLWSWDFGDGSPVESSITPSISHHYTEEGVFTVTLTVTDDEGMTDSASTTATIQNPIQESPIAEANGPYSGFTNNEIQFSSAGSFDSDGIIVEYFWDFGDGSTSTDANPTHTYVAADTYTVSLIVTDDDGLTDIDTTTATIVDDEDALVVLSVNQSTGLIPFTPEFMASLIGNAPFDVTINFDDGSGQGFITNDTLIAFQHTYVVAGTYNPSITIIDANGDSATDSVTVIATDTNIAAQAAIDANPREGEPPLLVSFSGARSTGDGPIQYFWDFDASNGIQVDATGVNAQHVFDEEGEFIVTLTIIDANGDTSTTTIIIFVSDDIENVGRDQTFLDEVMIENGDYMFAGEELMVLITATNVGNERKLDEKISVSIPELGLRSTSKQFDFKRGDRIRDRVILPIPEWAPSGYYTVRIVVSDDLVKRVKHRDIFII